MRDNRLRGRVPDFKQGTLVIVTYQGERKRGVVVMDAWPNDEDVLVRIGPEIEDIHMIPTELVEVR